MANVSEITTMCRNGQVQEAYDLAKHDLELQPADVWLQRALGWALYYMMKNLAERGDYEKLLECIDELKTLDQITSEDMVFDLKSASNLNDNLNCSKELEHYAS